MAQSSRSQASKKLSKISQASKKLSKISQASKKLPEISQAWNQRPPALSGAQRVFHGPGEGERELKQLTIDRFNDHCWLTWSSDEKISPSLLQTIKEFLTEKEIRSAVLMNRPKKGALTNAEIILGEPPDLITVTENEAKIIIKFKNVKHPGLFLDHEPLRRWLFANSKDLRVFNTFAYTGSLSVACGLGGAASVTSVDLSKTTNLWSIDNWKANDLDASKLECFSEDVFELLPKMKKRNRSFQMIILDPPSFSRGKKGIFSTEKDLGHLHELALSLLEKGGTLVTSINSANILRAEFRGIVEMAARAAKRSFQILHPIELPSTFPTLEDKGRYLKGWCLKFD